MKRLLHALAAIAIALGLAVVAVPDASAQQPKFKGKGGPPPQVHNNNRHRGNKTGKIVGGVAAGIAGAIILNEIAKSQSGPSYREERGYYRGDSGGGLSCRQLNRRCDDGQDWACRKFDRQC